MEHKITTVGYVSTAEALGVTKAAPLPAVDTLAAKVNGVVNPLPSAPTPVAVPPTQLEVVWERVEELGLGLAKEELEAILRHVEEHELPPQDPRHYSAKEAKTSLPFVVTPGGTIYIPLKKQGPIAGGEDEALAYDCLRIQGNKVTTLAAITKRGEVTGEGVAIYGLSPFAVEKVSYTMKGEFKTFSAQSYNSARDWLTEGRASVRKRLECAQSIAEQVDYLHQNERVHGAVVVDNIRIGNGYALGYHYLAEPPSHERAPELKADSPPTQEGDLYQLGRLIEQLINLHRGSISHPLSKGLEGELTKLSVALQDPDPTQRPQAAKVADRLSHLLKDLPPDRAPPLAAEGDVEIQWERDRLALEMSRFLAEREAALGLRKPLPTPKTIGFAEATSRIWNQVVNLFSPSKG